MGGAEISIRVVGPSEQQFFYIVLNCAGVVPDDNARAGSVSQAIGVGSLEIPAELDGVIPSDPREMFRPVPGLIRTRGDRVSLHATNVSTVAQLIEIHIR